MSDFVGPRGPKLRLLIEGDKLVADEMKKLGERARDAKPVLRVINELMRLGAIEQFESEGSRGGFHWEPDKPETVRRKLARGEDPRTERASRDLEASLLVRGAGNISRLSAHSTTYGTRLFYAVFQGHRRQLLRVTLHDADRWAELMVDWILSGNVSGKAFSK